jgi:hypothetical protein
MRSVPFSVFSVLALSDQPSFDSALTSLTPDGMNTVIPVVAEPLQPCGTRNVALYVLPGVAVLCASVM